MGVAVTVVSIALALDSAMSNGVASQPAVSSTAQPDPSPIIISLPR